MATRREVIAGAGAAVAAGVMLKGVPAFAQQTPFKIGVFVSKEDFYQPDAFDALVEPYVTQMRLGLELAAGEINASGGLLGRPIEFTFVNDGGSPPTADAVAGLVDETGVEAIVAGFVQAAPRLVSIRSDNRVPVLYAFWTEGAYCGPVAKHFGPTVQQIVPSITAHVDAAALERPFTICNWTPSGRVVSRYLYDAGGGIHVGDALVTTPYPGNHPGQYRGVLNWAAEMEARLIWQADPRPYAVNVFNQAVELGLAERFSFAFVDFSEWQAEQMAPGGSIVGCLPFVASDPSEAVQDFVARARALSSDGLITHVAFTHYNSIMALKAAIEKSGEATAAGALAGFEGGLSIETATGPLTLEPGGHSTMPMFVIRAENGKGIEIVAKLEPLASGSTC